MTVQYKLLQLVGIIAGALLVFFSLRDILFRSREAQRQRSIDDIVKETMNLQKSATQQQLQLGELHLADAEKNLRQQGEGIQNVNQVIDVVRQTLAFRLEQEEKVAATIKEIERMKAERERARSQKLIHAQAILAPFKAMSRMEFASLTNEQYKRGVRLQDLVNDLGEFLTDQDTEVAGSLLYACGVVAYYDNDVIEAKSYFDRAAQSRAPDHDGTLRTSSDYRTRFAFIHYFRGLIQKNWGDLSEARHEIDQSAKLLEGREDEFLTPVTRAEILSYIIGSEEPCRSELESLLRRLDEVEAALNGRGERLNANQLKLRNRILILAGNTHFVLNGLQKALEYYTRAITLDPSDYYALASAAQCERGLGNEIPAATHYLQCLEAIEQSGDIRRKRERITRATIALLAAQAARRSGKDDRREPFAREARELLSGNLAVDGLSPRFFSPATKRLVDATELLQELETQ